MKLAKLSLAAIVVAGFAASAFASDTLADAFKNGKVNGTLKAYYSDRDTGAAGTSSNNIFDLGATLGYVTGSFNGLKAGLTYQAMGTPDADDSAKSMYGGDLYGSGGVLSEAYVAYTLDKTTAKVGRQFVSTPLVAGSGSRVTKESFQGALLLNTDVPNTTLAAAYVNKFQTRTTADGGRTTNIKSRISQFGDTVYADGVGYATVEDAWTLLAINSSVPNLTLVGQYANVHNVDSTGGDVSVYYVDGAYAIPTDFAKFSVAAQFFDSSTDSVIENALGAKASGNVWGAKVSMAMDNGLSGYLAYNTNSDEITVAGLGNGVGAYAGAVYYGSDFGANVDTITANVAYDFSKIGVSGLKALVRYSNFDRPNGGTGTGSDMAITNGQLVYAFSGGLKGLKTIAQYENRNYDDSATDDYNEFRFKAYYSF